MHGVIKAQETFSNSEPADSGDSPVEIARPARAIGPLVFASPHSGRWYAPEFVRQSALDALRLRASEDAYVDMLMADAPHLGAPLVTATFPRAYVDANRHPWELDPHMFSGALPSWVQARSPRVAAGLGAVPRIVADGAEIYRERLPAQEADRRMRLFHQPYHQALNGVLEETRARFGVAILVDCHSMPSAGHERVDAVLGDRFGVSCDRRVTAALEQALRAEGLRVARNTPYAGGYSTERYGRPAENAHAIQLELNRALYLNEARVEPHGGFDALKAALTRTVKRLLSADLL